MKKGMNEGLNQLANFLDKQIEKLNTITQEDFITSELRKELNRIISKENFETDSFSGGDATISVINHSCPIMGYNTVINGRIRFVVEKWNDNPCETIISEDGYFEGYAFIWDETNQASLFNEELIIAL